VKIQISLIAGEEMCPEWTEEGEKHWRRDQTSKKFEYRNCPIIFGIKALLVFPLYHTK